MELVERYLQAVKFWLPREKQDDIIAELGDDIRSEIDEQEAALGHPLEKGDLETLLKRRGPPVLVAERFLPQRHLIGPMWFPIYWLVLRIATAVYIVPWLVVWLILVLNSSSYRAAHPGMAIFGTLGTVWTIFWVQFAVVTLAFAALERFQSREKFIEQWKPSQLPRLRRNPDRVSRADSAFGLVFGVIFLSWIAGLPALPGIALGPAADYLAFAPALHAYYLPVVLITLAGMAQQGLNLARPDWTWLPPVIRLVTGAASLVLVNSLLKVYPYVELVDPAANWQRYGVLIGVLNTTIQISVAATGLGFAIACGFYAFQCFAHLRRWIKRSGGASPVHPGGDAGLSKGSS